MTTVNLRRWTFLILILGLGLGVSAGAAETKAQTRYVSDVDKSLWVEKISILPFIDNVGQIYSQTLTDTTKNFFEKGQQWSPKISSGKATTENLTPAEVKKITGKDATQALLSGRVWKGPQGVQMRLILYLASDGQPLIIENVDDIKAFSTEGLSRELTMRLLSIYQKFPTQGLVLSRRANEVTVNMGSYQGLQIGDTLNVIQIVQVQRHPKQQFMVGHDKTLLGQIKLFKVDQFLSFGQISLEKEAGVIQVNSKVKPDQYIQYNLADDGTVTTLRDKLQQRPEGGVAFGGKAQEWQPRQPPQYGRLQLEAGFSQYNQNLSLPTDSINASNSLAPTIAVSGEAWLNDEWFIDLGIKQSAFSVSNTLSGSSPSSINMSLSSYRIGGGYNFLFEDNFWGPKFQVSIGIAQFSSRADEANPLFASSMDFGGMYLGFKGGFPLGEEIPWDLGFQFKYYLSNSLSESKSSGNSNGLRATDFGFYGAYKTKRGFNITGELNFEYYSAGFTGGGVRTTPVSSISHKLTSLLAGIEYFF